MSRIVIVDYGMGNLGSVRRALAHVAPEADIRISGAAAEIDEADRVVFPGQGAMPDCMRTLDASGLRPAVMRACASKPLLGVCVGMQMLFDRCEEGPTDSLGVLGGEGLRFRGPAFEGPDRLKVPQIGWNRVKQTQPHALWHGIADGAWFYFVHSYYMKPIDPSVSVGESEYGHAFTCAVARNNIFATQFHPEKSAQAGLQLYRNFVSWQP